MRALALAAFVGMAGVSACVVRSFDVDPASTTGGATSSGGAATAGRSAGGGTSGGKASGGGANGGGNQAVSGGGNEAGAGPIGNGLGPMRVGFSIFNDSAGGGDDASGDSTDATFTKPAGTLPGDFMLVFLGVDHNLSHLSNMDLAPTGWKLLDEHGGYGEDGQGTYLLYKFATDAEPDSIVFVGVNPEHFGVQGLLSVYRGVNTKDPINDYAASVLVTGNKTKTHVDTPTPPITTSVDNCLVIAGLSPDSAIDAPKISAWPEGFDENQVSVTNPTMPPAANTPPAMKPTLEMLRKVFRRSTWACLSCGQRVSLQPLSFKAARLLIVSAPSTDPTAMPTPPAPIPTQPSVRRVEGEAELWSPIGAGCTTALLRAPLAPVAPSSSTTEASLPASISTVADFCTAPS